MPCHRPLISEDGAGMGRECLEKDWDGKWDPQPESIPLAFIILPRLWIVKILKMFREKVKDTLISKNIHISRLFLKPSRVGVRG